MTLSITTHSHGESHPRSFRQRKPLPKGRAGRSYLVFPGCPARNPKKNGLGKTTRFRSQKTRFGPGSGRSHGRFQERLGRGCGGQWEVWRCWVDEGALWLRNSVILAVLSTGKQKERIPSSNGIVFQFFLAASCSNWRGAISPFFWLLSAPNSNLPGGQRHNIGNGIALESASWKALSSGEKKRDGSTHREALQVKPWHLVCHSPGVQTKSCCSWRIPQQPHFLYLC